MPKEEAHGHPVLGGASVLAQQSKAFRHHRIAFEKIPELVVARAHARHSPSIRELRFPVPRAWEACKLKENEHIDVVRRYFDACNSGALEDFKPTLAEDVIHYFLPHRFAPIRGADHLARFWRKFKQASNTVWAIEEIIAQGDRVVSEWYEMSSGVISEVRAYFAYDETGDAELTGFPYRDRRYLME